MKENEMVKSSTCSSLNRTSRLFNYFGWEHIYRISGLIQCLGLNRIGHFYFIYFSALRLLLSVSVGEMVRLFHTLSPAISRLNFIHPRIFLAASPSIRLQRNHVHNKLKPKISPSSSSKFQRTRAYSTTTRVSSLTKRESWKLDDDGLVVLGIETSCDDTAAAVVSPFGLYFSLCLGTFKFTIIEVFWFFRWEGTVRFLVKSFLLR